LPLFGTMGLKVAFAFVLEEEADLTAALDDDI
jgi:hypothetical protein